MKITNKNNLSEPIYKAILNQHVAHKKADYSITELIQPPRITVLKTVFWDKLEEDASDRLDVLMGSTMHKILEENPEPGALVEKYYEMNFELGKVSGTVDYYYNKRITDWKLASVWEYIYGLKEEKVQQLNCYAAMMRAAGHPVDELKIEMIFRDWHKSQTVKNGYPQKQHCRFDVDLWNYKDQLEFIEHRLQLVKEAEKELPECTPEERWLRDEKWAIKKRGVQKAVKLFDEAIDARQYILSLHPTDLNIYSIEHRPGVNSRCENWCTIGKCGFCDQFNRLKEAF